MWQRLAMLWRLPRGYGQVAASDLRHGDKRVLFSPLQQFNTAPENRERRPEE